MIAVSADKRHLPEASDVPWGEIRYFNVCAPQSNIAIFSAKALSNVGSLMAVSAMDCWNWVVVLAGTELVLFRLHKIAVFVHQTG